MTKPTQVVFICTGNTCRSPMAAALFNRHLQAQEASQDIAARSAGLYAAQGQSAAEGASKALRRWGISLADHRSQPISAELVAKTDLFLTMTDAHRNLLIDLYPEAREYSYTLGEYVGMSGTDVADPFGADDSVYRQCAEQLDKLLALAARRLVGGDQAVQSEMTTAARKGDAMRIAFGCDHAGFDLKGAIVDRLRLLGHVVVDKGTFGTDSVDYPDFGQAVAEAVTGNEADLGVLVCGTGIGISMAANKVTGARAALCHDTFSARMSRAHNDANILCLGSRVVGSGLALDIVEVFLDGRFEGGRHAGRVQKINALDKGSAGT